MVDTLGLLAEAVQLATDLGYDVREELLGDFPGGACRVGGASQILVNLDLAAADRLAVILTALAADERTSGQPMSRSLAARLMNRATPGPPRAC
jgi:hypothetical protein